LASQRLLCSALNLGSPGGLDVGVGGAVHAGKKIGRQFRSLIQGKLKSIPEQILCTTTHRGIIAHARLRSPFGPGRRSVVYPKISKDFTKKTRAPPWEPQTRGGDLEGRRSLDAALAPTLLAIIHVFVCLFLILVVLLQQGRGGRLGRAFGGQTQQVFGGRGAGNFMTRVTWACAMVFTR
jgi:protein translocase SecG subunit